MTNDDYKCSIRGCKGEPEVRLLGKWLCAKHYHRHCVESD